MKIKMNKHKLHGKLIVVLIIILFGIFVTAAIFSCRISRNDKGKIFVAYNELLLSANKEYIGYIASENKKVSIVNYFGKEISHMKIKDKYPAQIALGKSSYFLLYRWESENGDGKIVQYDYQSHKIKEILVHNIATITCRNGYLFLGGWKREAEDLFFYFIPCYNSFYANRYLQEEKFGNQIKDLTVNQDGWCEVADIKLYYHSEVYFSTEPMLDDYPGTSQGDFSEEDKKFNYQAETKREGKNRNMLLQKMSRTENIQNSFYQICDYQSGKNIYVTGDWLFIKENHRCTPLKWNI